MSRNLRIVLTVLLLHGAALWALQTGLLRRTAELLIPAMMLADMAEPAVKPEPEPPVPQPPQSSPHCGSEASPRRASGRSRGGAGE